MGIDLIPLNPTLDAPNQDRKQRLEERRADIRAFIISLEESGEIIRGSLKLPGVEVTDADIAEDVAAELESNPFADPSPIVRTRADGRYNWTGWQCLISYLEDWGMDTSEFSSTNDCVVICDETCKKVADAIEEHLPELSDTDQKWLRPHVAHWRTCGGYAQY